jgi:hypothetical protein
MEVDTGSDFGVGCGAGSAPTSTLVGEPGDQESSDGEELLGTIWVPHRDHGFVRVAFSETRLLAYSICASLACEMTSLLFIVSLHFTGFGYWG